MFSQLVSSRFIKDLGNLYPSIKDPTLIWDLSLVLRYLLETTFEPSGNLLLGSLTYEYDLSISYHISLQRGEDWALMADPPIRFVFQRQGLFMTTPKILTIDAVRVPS